MRIVTSETVANRRGMHRSLDVCGFFICMAGNAKRGWGCGDELDAGDVFVDADLMTACATGGHGGMNGFAFVLAFVALEALGGGGVLVEGDGMYGCASSRRQQREHG